MSAIKSWALWCDHPECADADSYGNDRGFVSVIDLRCEARANGWTRRNGKDFCPDHSGDTREEYVATTTESYRTRHLSRPEDLVASPPRTPGRHGQSLCQVNNLGGVIDQARADFWRRGLNGKPVIANLPLCKRCERIAKREQDGDA